MLHRHSASCVLVQESGHKALGGDVKCLEVSPVPQGRTGAPFLAVGMTDASVRILSLTAEDLLENRATQVGSACALTICLHWHLQSH